MAQPLKNGFGQDVPRRIADAIATVHSGFRRTQFLATALQDYEALELMPRGRQIAAALHESLPAEYDVAIGILLDSLDALAPDVDLEHPMGSFVYMPHCLFVSQYGVEHFDLSMQANYELTQRFTAEFSIRPFISRYPGKTLALLARWAQDPSEHVRRLVSEGTRPRLPWASRLPEFQRDPTPVLALLELLKDDRALYVRRSVANNLNDIGKDHPETLVRIARAWMKDASVDRKWLIGHALRTAVKGGDAGALRVLGYGDATDLTISKVRITPQQVKIGDNVTVALDVTNEGRTRRRVMIDFRIHYVKANGTAKAKVFKLKAADLAPGTSIHVEKRVSVANMTTRKHYPGRHQIEALLNGQPEGLGFFDLDTGTLPT